MWPRAAAWLLIVAVAGAVVGGLAWRLSIPAPGAIGQPPVAPSDAAANTPNPTSGATQPTESATAEKPVAPTTTAVAWQGTALPVSTEAGPSTFTATRSTGFADTPQGAALAAVHISTHIDPYTGPGVFTPAITEQVIGAKEGLLSRTQQIYREAADQMGVSGGAPVLVPTGSVQSWRIRDFQPDGTDVELLVATPTGEQVVYRIPVKWVRGDWRLLVPNSDGEVFEVGKPRGLSGFTPFIDFPGGAR